ncbi:MAG: histidine phosphatase family protein [Propionivibrio sp.]|nr:histidine phosphatase family protein [Propionivibrio sp.]
MERYRSRRARCLGHRRFSFCPPGGESPARLQQRAIGFAASLAGSRVALVTHAGVMRALVGHWRRLPLAEWTQLKFGFSSITEIEI